MHVLPRDPNAAYLQTLSPVEQGRWREALDGTTDASVTLEDGEPVYYMKDGCVTEARHELWSDVARWLSLTTEREKVSFEILDRAEGSDGYQRALRSWRACMKERGHTAKDPLTLYDKLWDDYERAELLTGVRDREMRWADSAPESHAVDGTVLHAAEHENPEGLYLTAWRARLESETRSLDACNQAGYVPCRARRRLCREGLKTKGEILAISIHHPAGSVGLDHRSRTAHIVGTAGLGS